MKSLFILLFSLIQLNFLYSQEKIVEIDKDVVYWEKTLPKKEYLKYLKSGYFDVIKSMVSNASLQKALFQETELVSFINTISMYDEVNPENALDLVYNEIKSYCDIEWIKGPTEVYSEVEKKRFGKDVIVIKVTTFGKFKRSCKDDFPKQDYLINLIKKNAKSPSKNKIDEKNFISQDCFNSEDYDRVIKQMKNAYTSDILSIAKNAFDKHKCISAKQAIGFAKNMYSSDMDDWALYIIPYVTDIENLGEITQHCFSSDVKKITNAIEDEIFNRNKR